jgi:riboflavin synthase
VDGVGTIVHRAYEGLAVVLFITLPASLAKYTVEKGSIALNGVSLTLSSVVGPTVSVHIIPHTQETTTLAALQVGDMVNIEVDMFAKYLEKMLCSTPLQIS